MSGKLQLNTLGWLIWNYALISGLTWVLTVVCDATPLYDTFLAAAITYLIMELSELQARARMKLDS